MFHIMCCTPYTICAVAVYLCTKAEGKREIRPAGAASSRWIKASVDWNRSALFCSIILSDIAIILPSYSTNDQLGLVGLVYITRCSTSE